MNRRGFLAALGLAPVAAVAATPEANGGTVRAKAQYLVGEKPSEFMVSIEDVKRWGTEIERTIAARRPAIVREVVKAVEMQERRKIRRRP